MTTDQYHTCPDCKNLFVQPFKCTTCGAEQLYDVTVRSQATQIERLRPDAERYRWLRDHIAPTICARIDKTITHGTPEKLDELIDLRRAS